MLNRLTTTIGSLLIASLAPAVATAAPFTTDLIATTTITYAGGLQRDSTFSPPALIGVEPTVMSGTLTDIGDALTVDASFSTSGFFDASVIGELLLTNGSLTNEISVSVVQSGTIVATASDSEALSTAEILTVADGPLLDLFSATVSADLLFGDEINGDVDPDGVDGNARTSTSRAFATVVLAPGEQQSFTFAGSLFADFLVGDGVAGGIFDNSLTIEAVAVRSLVAEPTSLGLLFAGAAPLMLGRVRRSNR